WADGTRRANYLQVRHPRRGPDSRISNKFLTVRLLISHCGEGGPSRSEAILFKVSFSDDQPTSLWDLDCGKNEPSQLRCQLCFEELILRKFFNHREMSCTVQESNLQPSD